MFGPDKLQQYHFNNQNNDTKEGQLRDWTHKTDHGQKIELDDDDERDTRFGEFIKKEVIENDSLKPVQPTYSEMLKNNVVRTPNIDNNQTFKRKPE